MACHGMEFRHEGGVASYEYVTITLNSIAHLPAEQMNISRYIFQVAGGRNIQSRY